MQRRSETNGMSLHIKLDNDAEYYSWTRGQIFSDLGVGGHLVSTPAEILEGSSGLTNFAMEVTGQSLENYGELFCVYYSQLTQLDPNTTYWFAVLAYQPVNYLSLMGYPGYWQIASGIADDVSSIPVLASTRFSEGQNLWRTPVDDPSESYILHSPTDTLPPTFRDHDLKIMCVGEATTTEDVMVTVTLSDVKV